MWRKINKDLVAFIVLIPLFLIGAFYVSSQMQSKFPSYSVINKSESGLSVFYEALRDQSMSVDRLLTEVPKTPTDTIQIIAEGGAFDINSAEISSWVEKGGVLIYLAPSDLNFLTYDANPKIQGNVILYKYHKGMIITTNVDNITNRALLTKTSDAYELLKQISNYPDRKIFFNESNLYNVTKNISLWDYFPIEMKFIIYQIILVIISLFYYKGNRFGKPVLLYDEIERNENEYLYSAASLYREAKCYDLMVQNYYRNFLTNMKRNEVDWLNYWKQEGFPDLTKADKLYEFMHKSFSKVSSKEYIKTLTIIQELNNIIIKRRDLYWKVLKKIL